MKKRQRPLDFSDAEYLVQRSHPHRQRCFIIAVLCGQVLFAAQCLAQTLTVPEMLANESQWKMWAAEGRKVWLTGRYRKREDQKFFLDRMPVPFLAPKSNPITEKLPEDQLMTISGKLLSVDNKLVFEVNKWEPDETDDVRKCRAEVEAVAADRPERCYEIADRYQKIAEFYEDRELKEQVQSARIEGFRRIGQQKQKDPAALWEHAETAIVMQLPGAQQLRSEVRFQAVLSALSKPSRDAKSILAKMKMAKNETGWETPDHSWNSQQEQQYQKDPVAMYRAADETLRGQLRRRVFREFTKQQLFSELNSDGSNGIEIARRLLRDIPEEPTAAVAAEEKEVQFLQMRIGTLNHGQLETLCRVLLKHQHPDQSRAAQDQWLSAQEKRFEGAGLDGHLRLAAEFFFVADTWSRDDARARGVDVLKAAWTVAGTEAPPEAEKIAERLKALGWERVQNQWMTSTEISSLPKSDIQRAMREGRVVVGMTVEQVAGTLGRPSRITRMASGKLMRELWVYDAPGTAGVIVQFVRSRGESAKESRVSEVGKVRQR